MAKQTQAQTHAQVLATQLTNTTAALAAIQTSHNNVGSVIADQVIVLKENKTEYIHLFAKPAKTGKATTKANEAKHAARYKAIIMGVVTANYGVGSAEVAAMVMTTAQRKKAGKVELAKKVTQSIGTHMSRLRINLREAYGIAKPIVKPKGKDGTGGDTGKGETPAGKGSGEGKMTLAKLDTICRNAEHALRLLVPLPVDGANSKALNDWIRATNALIRLAVEPTEG
jgi:hypothetical protein